VQLVDVRMMLALKFIAVSVMSAVPPFGIMTRKPPSSDEA
jgi:hypothetical protein